MIEKVPQTLAKLLLHSPLMFWAPMASNAYHDGLEFHRRGQVDQGIHGNSMGEQARRIPREISPRSVTTTTPRNVSTTRPDELVLCRLFHNDQWRLRVYLVSFCDEDLGDDAVLRSHHLMFHFHGFDRGEDLSFDHRFARGYLNGHHFSWHWGDTTSLGNRIAGGWESREI